MTDPIETAVKADVTAEETKLKAVWTHWSPYLLCAICLIVGLVLGHKF